MERHEDPLDLTAAHNETPRESHAAPRPGPKVVTDGEAKIVVSPEGIDIGVHELISFRVPQPSLGPVGDALVTASISPNHYAFILPDGRVLHNAPTAGEGSWLSVSSDKNEIVTLSRFASGLGGGFKSWDMHADIAMSLGMSSQEIACRLQAQTPADMMRDAGGVAVFTHSELMLGKYGSPRSPTLADHIKRVEEISPPEDKQPPPAP